MLWLFIPLGPWKNELFQWMHSLCTERGCDQKNEEIFSALVYLDVWGWSASQLWKCKPRKACSGWWGTNLIPLKERGLPDRVYETNALTWLLHYNHRGLLGSPWWVACAMRTHRGCAVGSPFQMLFLGMNYFVMLCKAPKHCRGWGRKVWLIPNFK